MGAGAAQEPLGLFEGGHGIGQMTRAFGKERPQGAPPIRRARANGGVGVHGGRRQAAVASAASAGGRRSRISTPATSAAAVRTSRMVQAVLE